MKYPLVTFAVCAYNEEKVIADCLRHIQNLDYPNKEIIVGSDGTDKTTEIAKGFGVNVITSRQRMGKTQMLMRIIKEAKGEIIVINDAEFFMFPNNAVYEIVESFKNKKIGGLSFGSSAPAETEFTNWWGLVESVIQDLFRYYRVKKNPLTSLKDANFVIVANAFRKDVITKLETINDDAEIAYQLLSKGYHLLYVSTVAFYSKGGPAKSISDNVKQRSRTTVGWVQIGKLYKINFLKFYIESFWLFLKLIGSLIVWIGVFMFSYLRGRFFYLIGRRTSKQVWKKVKRR
jgi:cellulose synthase/poly-beta-1,6-N-acetylglucosamine synthase-like glycosyltransferase